METVKLQCGNCRNLMAISVEHLGGQVQCPHCKAVVQTAAPEKPSEADAPDPEVTQDNFPPVPKASSEAVMGGEPAAAPSSASVEESEEEALPKFKPRPVYDKNLVPIIGLIFLVPYAFFTTLFIIYLVFFRPGGNGDGLDNLRDPNAAPAKGGAKRVEGPEFRPQHDQPLVAKWRTSLGQPIQAGSLLVTPLHIRRNDEGDLQLLLRAKNTSAQSAFQPIHETFAQLSFKDKANKPYSFIESRSKRIDNLYGMDTFFYRDVDARKEWNGSTSLRPGEEMTVSLVTYDRYRDKQVAEILKNGDDYTWRIHVRKGFMRVDNKDVSATMVIGVDFTSAQIEGKKT